MVRLVEGQNKLHKEKLEAVNKKQGEQLAAVTKKLAQVQTNLQKWNPRGPQERPGEQGQMAAMQSGVPPPFEYPSYPD